MELQQRPLDAIQPSPENDQIYDPVDTTDKDFRALVDSVRRHGIIDPLVVSRDGYIVSGHRRYAAAQSARLQSVPCRIAPIRRQDDVDAFVRLLREFNRQRNKSFAEKAREVLVDIDAKEAHGRLISERAAKSVVKVEAMQLEDRRVRAGISKAKRPMLDAVLKVLKDRRQFWPLSVRQVHYALLNDPPLKHAAKPGSRYANDLESYKNLDSLLVRARLNGTVSRSAIADETRPVTTWTVFRDPQPFIRDALSNLLCGYYRDLMQSQPNHIEVLVEKNTVAKICETVCAKYCIPMTSGRGFCSLPPRQEMERRYRRSGKDKLILLVASDFDPEGETIAESFARYMRDDFGIDDIWAVKVALTSEQVEKFNLPPDMTAKLKSTNRKKFVERHGENVWELEALEPEQLQTILDQAIRAVIDVDAFNAEVEAEAEDAARIEAMRETVRQVLQEADLNGLDDDEDFDDEDEFDD
jgi:ParB-like chromosome segregation protein Spo0J